MTRSVIQQKNINSNDIKCNDVIYNKNNRIEDNTPLEDGFEYPKKSMSYKLQHKAEIGQRKALSRMQYNPNFKNAGVEILKRSDSRSTEEEEPTPCAEKRVPIDAKSISILIGARGRNISLICKFARVYMSIEDNHMVTFTPRKNSSEHSLDLAHRMMISMIAGGVLRWFNHPAATNKYFHPSVRAELENMVAATSQCTLELLRSRNGHLCLVVLANSDANLEYVEEQIRNLRPILLEKINLYAQNPSTNDPSYDNEGTPHLSQTISDV